jgi:5-methylthioribose kinase
MGPDHTKRTMLKYVRVRMVHICAQAQFEYTGLQEKKKICPDHVPEVFHFDK